MTEQQFRLIAANAEQPPVVCVTGDVDLANVDEFAAVLARAAADSTTITVDLTRVSYCDSAAVRALFSIAASTKLSLVIPDKGPITTLLGISGLDRVATVTIGD
ncbi:STAS domain-containing protein [Mycolicibacterium sp. XJ1819]